MYHHTHGDVGVDVAGMGGLAKFFSVVHTRGRNSAIRHCHMSKSAHAPRRGRRVACMWRVGRIIYTVPTYLTVPLVLLSCILIRQSTLKLPGCETIQSNFHNDKNNNITIIMSDQNTSTLQSTYEKVTGAAQSALGSLTGSTADKAQGERKYPPIAS